MRAYSGNSSIRATSPELLQFQIGIWCYLCKITIHWSSNLQEDFSIELWLGDLSPSESYPQGDNSPELSSSILCKKFTESLVCVEGISRSSPVVGPGWTYRRAACYLPAPLVIASIQDCVAVDNWVVLFCLGPNFRERRPKRAPSASPTQPHPLLPKEPHPLLPRSRLSLSLSLSLSPTTQSRVSCPRISSR